MQCKLYVFEKTTQSWIERGRGLLRLNDMASTDDGTLQSRLGKPTNPFCSFKFENSTFDNWLNVSNGCGVNVSDKVKRGCCCLCNTLHGHKREPFNLLSAMEQSCGSSLLLFVFLFKILPVMRTQGSLRLILNTKLWPQMQVDKASEKGVRITAMDTEDQGVKVFLISVCISNDRKLA